MSKRYLAISVLVIVAAFALRMWHIDSESIWHDEGWSIRAVHGPFTTPDDNTPFVYYFSGHIVWRMGGGDTPLALRYISVLWGVLTAAAALQVGRRWAGFWPGLAFGALIATSPLLWEYAQEVRAYVVIPLVALALLAAADRLLRYDREKVPRMLWAGIFAIELIGIYTHNLAVPLVVWLNGSLGVVWLIRSDWRRIATWSAIQITLIVCYIPWLLTQSPSGTPLNTPPEPGLSLIRNVWVSYFLPALPQFEDALAGAINGFDLLPILNGVALVLIALTAMALVSKRTLSVRMWLLISQAIGIPILTTALMLAANIDFHPRYYIASVPGTLLLFIYALSQISQGTAQRVLLAVITIIFTGITAISLHQITTTRTYQHDDFASLAAYYDSLPADAVILIPFDDEPAIQYYFDRVLDIEAQMVNIPLYSAETTAIEAINALNTDHVELLTWFQLPADPRGMYPCLLTAASQTAPGAEQTYFGLMTQKFDVGSVEMTPFDATPTYRDIRLVDSGYTASPYGTCVQTIWSIDGPQMDNLQVAAALLNPFGQPMARVDAAIARDDNAGTAVWHIDDTGAAYNLLTPSAGVPDDTYPFTLNVYSQSQPSGLDLLDDVGNPAGVNYTVDDAVRASGQAAVVEVAEIVTTSAEMLQSGQGFDVTLLLPAGSLPATVTLAGDDWEIEQEATSQRSWHRFDVPVNATDSATLAVNGETLATYLVEGIERIFDEPDYDAAVSVEFVDVGKLVGASATGATAITLIWQATGDTPLDYTVFVQLLSPDGQVVAQSDSPPVGGQRPTTGWVDDEYIIDTHLLRLNLPDYTGEVRVIAGLYNPVDFVRVATLDGTDNAELPLDLRID